MNFNKAVGIVKSTDTLADGTVLTYREVQERIIDFLGRDKVMKCVPFSKEVLEEAYKADKYFNNLPMKKWDLAGGFIIEYGRASEYPSTLRSLAVSKGVTIFSPSDMVSILKHAACMMIGKGDK